MLCLSCIIIQDRVPAFSPKKARSFIESELGAPIKVLFKEFEDQPIAAASLGQVFISILFFNNFYVQVLKFLESAQILVVPYISL